MQVSAARKQSSWWLPSGYTIEMRTDGNVVDWLSKRVMFESISLVVFLLLFSNPFLIKASYMSMQSPEWLFTIENVSFCLGSLITIDEIIVRPP